ncbi:uncharacterized protein TNCV_982941 [Trichonephila clavipes]|nr:uncharacterized protein TNCV_982941 [Trichonephila clavipes]
MSVSQTVGACPFYGGVTTLRGVSLSLAAIRMLMMDVPSPTNQGESVELICSYELDEDNLYSVKWYKDDVEFYRYVPNDWPPGQFLPLDGVRVDPTENSLAVLNHKILETNSQVQNVKLGGHQTCLSIKRLWHELCDMLRRLVGTTAPGHHDCSIQE